MRANRAFELLVSRDSREPAFLANRRRLDRLEVVSVDTGEVVLYWELPARAAAKLERRLRADLVSLDATAFMATWARADAVGEERR
ncbi:MAG: hypothetical protein JO321_11925 [Solirubrobacterales bacterium]|nr:hypothetical protein [Solirubrobacterales bacterium]MBV9536108.1 hypothetical protein [Solirubrobacterales bacterium]